MPEGRAKGWAANPDKKFKILKLIFQRIALTRMNIANQPFKFIENIHQRSSVNICQNSSPGMRHPDPESVAQKASHRINAKPLDIFRKTKKVKYSYQH